MKYLIKVVAFCHCFVLFAATQNVSPFPIGDSRLPEFKQMCEELAPIVKSSAAPPTCFLSYAWPEDPSSPLRSWFDAVHYCLTLAGVNVIYDTKSFTGDISKLEELARSASKVLIFLTPDYKIKCNKGTTLRNEIRIAFSKGIHNRSLVLLCGTVENGLPFEDIRGSYVPGNEMVNMMTSSDYRHQKEADGPSIDSFYNVMCNLLDPTKPWGLLTNVSRPENEKNCVEILQHFIKSSSVNVPKEVFLRRSLSVNSRFQYCLKAENPNKVVSDIPNLTCFFESGSESSEGSYLKRIFDFFNEKEQSAVERTDKRYNICGESGIGKTTLAIQYAHMSFYNKIYDIIFWIKSETLDLFFNGYRNLLQKLDEKIDVDGISDEEVVQTVKDKLKNFKSLLILDNFPSKYEGHESLAINYLESRLPNSKDNHTLITSQHTLPVDNIHLERFCLQESIEYLSIIKKSKEEEMYLQELATKIGGLPLALSYARAYIKTKNINIRQYISLFDNILRENQNISTNVLPFIVTFELSFRLLNEEEKKLFYILCYLNPDLISIDILSAKPIKNDKTQSINFFDNVISLLESLKSLSIITAEDLELKRVFSIHRLSQQIGKTKNNSSVNDHDITMRLLLNVFHSYLNTCNPYVFFVIYNNIQQHLYNIKTNCSLTHFNNLMYRVQGKLFYFAFYSFSMENAKIYKQDRLIMNYLGIGQYHFLRFKESLFFLLSNISFRHNLHVMSLLSNHEQEEIIFDFLRPTGSGDEKYRNILCDVINLKININPLIMQDGDVKFSLCYCDDRRNENKKAIDYYKAKHFDPCIIEKRYDPDFISICQLMIGMCYYAGVYFKTNYEKALECFIAASSSGNSDACRFAGIYYQIRNLFPDALFWYKKSMDLGNLAAQHSFGALLSEGFGRDEKETVSYGEELKRDAEEKGIFFKGPQIPIHSLGINYLQMLGYYQKLGEYCCRFGRTITYKKRHRSFADNVQSTDYPVDKDTIFLQGSIVYLNPDGNDSAISLKELILNYGGVFNFLSGQTDLIIHVGYKPNGHLAHRGKAELWIVQRHLLDKTEVVSPFKDVLINWPIENDVGLFLTFSDILNDDSYDYLIDKSITDISRAESVAQLLKSVKSHKDFMSRITHHSFNYMEKLKIIWDCDTGHVLEEESVVGCVI
ncbi:MAG: hypothetical protein HEEMFOPI_01635 [Holosporales bacterium]